SEPEHHVGDAGGRRGTELPGDVINRGGDPGSGSVDSGKTHRAPDNSISLRHVDRLAVLDGFENVHIAQRMRINLQRVLIQDDEVSHFTDFQAPLSVFLVTLISGPDRSE